MEFDDQKELLKLIEEKDDDTPPTKEEAAMVGLLYHMAALAVDIQVTDFKIWPVSITSHEHGTPWAQPYYRRRLMESFWKGVSDVREDKYANP